MAEIFTLTGPEARFNSTGVALAVENAVEVADFDFLWVTVFCTCLITIGSPSITVDLYTGMQTDSTDDWKVVASVTITAAGQTKTTAIPLLSSNALLRYAWWGVSTATNVTEAGICIRIAGTRKTALAYL